jgi:hypothetical protein
MILPTKLKLFAAGGLLIAVALFGAAFYLRGLEVKQCDMERAAMASIASQMKANNERALNEYKREVERQRRAKDSVMRDANAVKDNTTSPAIANASRLLCNQGAAGCGAGRAN